MKPFSAFAAVLALLALPLRAQADAAATLLPQTIALPMLDSSDVTAHCQLPSAFDAQYETTCILFKDAQATKTLFAYSRLLEQRGWRRDLTPQRADVLTYTRPVGPCYQTAFLFLDSPSATYDGAAFAVQRRPVCNGGAQQ